MKRTKIEPELERKRCQLEQMTKQSNSDIRELEKCEADVKNYEVLELRCDNFPFRVS